MDDKTLRDLMKSYLEKNKPVSEFMQIPEFKDLSTEEFMETACRYKWEEIKKGTPLNNSGRFCRAVNKILDFFLPSSENGFDAIGKTRFFDLNRFMPADDKKRAEKLQALADGIEKLTEDSAAVKKKSKSVSTIRNWLSGKNIPKKNELFFLLITLQTDVDSADCYLQQIGKREYLYALNIEEYVLLCILQHNQNNEHKISGEDGVRIIHKVSEAYQDFLVQRLAGFLKEEPGNYYALISCYEALALEVRNEWEEKKAKEKISRKIIEDEIISRLNKAGLQDIKSDGQKKYLTDLWAQELEKEEAEASPHKSAGRRRQDNRSTDYIKKYGNLSRRCMKYLSQNKKGPDADWPAGMSIGSFQESHVPSRIAAMTSYMRKLSIKSPDNFPLEDLMEDQPDASGKLEAWLQTYSGLFIFEWLSRQYACLEILKSIQEKLPDRNNNRTVKSFYCSQLQNCIPDGAEGPTMSSSFTEYENRRARISRKTYLKLILLMMTAPERAPSGPERANFKPELLEAETAVRTKCNYYLRRAHFSELSFAICEDAFLIMCLWLMQTYAQITNFSDCTVLITEINKKIEKRANNPSYRKDEWNRLRFIYHNTNHREEK